MTIYRVLECILVAPFVLYFLSLFLNVDDSKSVRRGFIGLIILVVITSIVELTYFMPEEAAKYVQDINKQILNDQKIIELHPGPGNFEANKLLLENGYREVGYYNQIKYFGRK